jgi:hypothetical protein
MSRYVSDTIAMLERQRDSTGLHNPCACGATSPSGHARDCWVMDSIAVMAELGGWLAATGTAEAVRVITGLVA